MEKKRERAKKEKKVSVPLALYFAAPVPQCSVCFETTFLGVSLLQNLLIHKRKNISLNRIFVFSLIRKTVYSAKPHTITHRSTLACIHEERENWTDKREKKGISILLNMFAKTPNYAQFLMKFFCMISSSLHLVLEEAHSKKSDLSVNRQTLVTTLSPPPPL